MSPFARTKRWLFARTLVGIEWSWVLLAWSFVHESWQLSSWVRLATVGVVSLLTLELWWVEAHDEALWLRSSSLWRRGTPRAELPLGTGVHASLSASWLYADVVWSVAELGSAVALRHSTRAEARRTLGAITSILCERGQSLRTSAIARAGSKPRVAETRTRAQALLTASAWLAISAILSQRGWALGALGALLGLGAWRDVASIWLGSPPGDGSTPQNSPIG